MVTSMHSLINDSTGKSSLLTHPLSNNFLQTNTNTVYNQSSDSRNSYTLADVYDDASVIGSELEKIITNYGSDVLKDLMPKVINVLELLESLTIKNEKENEEIDELKMKLHSLEYEKAQRNNEREKFEKELEEIEEKWQKESFKLLDMVNKLKDDNKRLTDLAQNSTMLKSDHLVIKQEELDYIKQIKEENIKLKETCRFKDRELEQKVSESEALSSQIETLTSTMLNFRRKQIVAQNQIEKMVKAKAELECTVTERDQQLNVMRDKLHKNNIQNEDQSNYLKLDEMPTPRTEERIKRPTQYNKNDSLETEISSDVILIDTKDPNRPRFTLKELQKVLMEKNQLTVKLDQTQDELEHLKRGETLTASYGDVQGPINKEPEEKLDPESKGNSTSGIRRLIMKVLRTGSNL